MNSSNLTEREANMYAADLLLPNYIFRNIFLEKHKKGANFIEYISKTFNVSKSPVMIKLVKGSYKPAVLVCHRSTGRKWFIPSPLVGDGWFPKNELDQSSSAFDIQFGGAPNDVNFKKISASAWFNGREAYQTDIRELTIRTSSEETLSFLLFPD